jgi:hypothetical protein
MTCKIKNMQLMLVVCPKEEEASQKPGLYLKIRSQSEHLKGVYFRKALLEVPRGCNQDDYS